MTTLKASTGPQFARILAVGSATPSRVIPNEFLLQYIDSSDEWITQRTGIKERRIAASDETTATLASAAGAAAIKDAGMTPSDIDLIIVATATPDQIVP